MNLTHIELKLGRATTLPIFPSVVAQVLAISDNQNLGVREFERIIMQDAALTAKILRTANSPAFQGNGQITTLQRALSQLGVNTVRSICVAVSFQSALTARTLPKRFHAQLFWQHSLAVACSARLLATLTRMVPQEEAFVGGLVHDLGKLALCMFMPVECEQVYRRMDEMKIGQHEAEMSCLKITHEEIGKMAAEKWGLPNVFFESISKHHNPMGEYGELDPMTAIVHVSNALAHEAGIVCTQQCEPREVDPMVKDYLGIPDAQYEPLRMVIAKEVARLSEQMRV